MKYDDSTTTRTKLIQSKPRYKNGAVPTTLNVRISFMVTSYKAIITDPSEQ